MDDDRSELDRIIALARPKTRRLESLTAIERREHQAMFWEAIAGALNDAYLEQRTGRCNYRLVQQDLFYARRVAVWMRFAFEIEVWRTDEANIAAEAIAKRAKGQTGASAVVSDELKVRLATKPVQPDALDPPILQPSPSDRPTDWPPMGWHWSEWIEELVRVRRVNAGVREREPGADESEDAGSGGAQAEYSLDSAESAGATPVAAAPAPEEAAE